ncbi:unnamed protein product [Peniophora sp. CBMAI 1063]|nr:unnamed protein product [Peniophora sp. CBMAI 1063]
MENSSLFLRLPVELVEEIVLCAAASGDPTAPATLALTCRALRSSILAAQTHLWRHLFLTLFDPPSHQLHHTYPWSSAYKARITAQLFFQARIVEPDRPAPPELVKDVLESLLDVLHSALPLDSRELEPDTPSNSTHPVFPPLSLVLHSTPDRVAPSLNTLFVSRILSPGLPPLLSSRLNAYCVSPSTSAELYDEPLARLVAAVGPLQAARAPPPRPFFGPHMPGTIVGAGAEGADEPLLRDPQEEQEEQVQESGELRVWRCSQRRVWEPERADGVRRLARIRAYDMSYLHPTRLHAPFLPLSPTTTQILDSALLVPTRSILSHTLDEISDASSDGDYSPHASPLIHSSSSSSSSTSTLSSTHSQSPSPASDQPAPAFPSPAPSPLPLPSEPAPAPLPGIPSYVPPAFAHIYTLEPPAAQLHFDWTWLSAARTVVQHNLRDLLAPRHAHALRALVALEGLRVGAAPGFVGGGASERPESGTGASATQGLGGNGKRRADSLSTAFAPVLEDTSFIDRDPNALISNSNPSEPNDIEVDEECPLGALAEVIGPGPVRADGSCYAFPEPGSEFDAKNLGLKGKNTSHDEADTSDDVERALGKGKGKGRVVADANDVEMQAEAADAKGKSKSKPVPVPDEEGVKIGEEGVKIGEECEGHDWAGVAGQWRRCVCWLDYKDLVAHNTHPFTSRFTDPTLYEVMRIVPMTLRVAKYTRSAHPKRPTIHVAGTVAGAQAAHCVWGKVEVVGGGEIRWSLFTLREDGESAWQSDGVQLGGPGSAAGVLGMWTSAEHEHMDPLGPFWAWKVGAPGARSSSGMGLGAAEGSEPQSVQGKRPSESSRREPER